MKILIVSIDDQVQLDHGALASTALKQRRERLQALLQKAIAEREVTFIGEEANPKSKRLTIAQRLARDHEPTIPWQNIDMTEAERKSAGIHDALTNRPFTLSGGERRL